MSIVVESGGGGHQASHDGSAGGGALGGGAMGVGEIDAVGREGVYVGRVNFSWVAAEAANPVIHVVDGEKEDIGRLRVFGLRITKEKEA